AVPGSRRRGKAIVALYRAGLPAPARAGARARGTAGAARRPLTVPDQPANERTAARFRQVARDEAKVTNSRMAPSPRQSPGTMATVLTSFPAESLSWVQLIASCTVSVG